MWLVDSKTLELGLHFEGASPPYAILSHAWGPNEISLQKFQGSHSSMQNNEGYIKIKKCCTQAAVEGFDYVWIDTCCIDKTNSAELSEAINSMFRWYRDAMECYVYLADVATVSDLKESRWFTRGWTLQELLAPSSCVFFNQNWEEIGTKATLSREISEITGIPMEALFLRPLQNYSVAQRMSWAANRKTTRKEDVAYSLLGIFNVNMPMIYGEGSRAFMRLQYEILKQSSDQSILAWNLGRRSDVIGPLAFSPAAFRGCGNIVQDDEQVSGEHAMTNKGLRIELLLSTNDDLLLSAKDGLLLSTRDELLLSMNDELLLTVNDERKNFSTALLNCKVYDLESRIFRHIGLSLEQLPEGRFARYGCSPLPLDNPLQLSAFQKSNHQRSLVYIVDSAFEVHATRFRRRPFQIKASINYDDCVKNGFRLLSKKFPADDMWGGRYIGENEIAGVMFEHTSHGTRFAIVFGLNTLGNQKDCVAVWANVEGISDGENLNSILTSYSKSLGDALALSERDKERIEARLRNSDRVTKELLNGQTVRVEIRKRNYSIPYFYKVNILIYKELKALTGG